MKLGQQKVRRNKTVAVKNYPFQSRARYIMVTVPRTDNRKIS
jgi:hypothetical protein